MSKTDLAGTKGGSGVWQRIISEMPEHEVYIEPFWGRGTIAKAKLPAKVTIGIDRDPGAINDGQRLDFVSMFRSCGLDWLKAYFHLRLFIPKLEPFYKAVPAGAATFGGFAWPEHFIYLDPPYLGVPNYYNYSLSPREHADLCRVFLALPCPAAISGYRTQLYDDMLKDCRRIEIPTVNRRGQRCTEILWMNYGPPSRYHDTRFVGQNRRVRERIRRRVKNWEKNLASMTPAERQAVWEACNRVFNEQVRQGDSPGA